MPKTLEEYYQDLLNAQQKSQQHQKLLTALKKYNDETARLRQPDQFGRIPLIDEEEKKKLMKLHREIAKNSEAVIHHYSTEPEVQQLVTNISSLASSNLNTLTSYDPKAAPKSLASLEEDTRSLTLDMRNAPEADKLGGAMSQRQVISFVDDKGKVITGLFTPKSEQKPLDALQNGLRDIAEKMPEGEGKKLVSQLMQKADYRVVNNPGYTDMKTAVAAYVVNSCMTISRDGIPSISTDRTARFIAKLADDGRTEEDVQAAIGADTMQQIVKVIDSQMGNTLVNGSEAKIPNGGRIDSRNSAMTAVAGLLDVPDLVAPARPMNIIDKNGNKIEGTFMMGAKGEDPLHPTKLSMKVEANSFKDMHGSAIKSISDLQALDYICGNVDRHDGNMFLQFDKNGKLLKVQGIDNDCSFGLAKPEAGETLKRLPSPENMKVMSKSMYKKIMKLDEDTLKYSLRGFGLSEAELDAAADRLKTLQDHLKKSADHYKAYDEKNPQPAVNGKKPPIKFDSKHKDMIRIVDDEDLSLVQSKDLIFPEKAKRENTFSNVRVSLGLLKAQYIENNKQTRELRGKAVIGAENRATAYGVKQAEAQGKTMEKLLDKTTHLFRSSQNYRDVEKAVAEYTKFQKQLRERMNAANKASLKNRPDFKDDLAAVVTAEDLRKMKELSAKVEAEADKYLNGKLGDGQNLDDYSDYTKSRIANVQMIRDIARQNKVITDQETKTMEINTRQAGENLSRRQGNLAATNAQKNGPVNQGPEPQGPSAVPQ